MVKIVIQNANVIYGKKPIVKNASFEVNSGELVVIIGPNGSGKSSLIKASLGLIPALIDDCHIDGLNILKAQHLYAYLPQERPLAWPQKVKDIVALGRFQLGANLTKLRQEDKTAIEAALTDCELGHLAERNADTLSGGEKSRMHLARAFAREAEFFLADEPTNALDLYHQIKIMKLIKAKVQEGIGALLVLHDIELAAKYADRILVMHEGAIVAEGTPQDVITSELLSAVYNIHGELIHEAGKPPRLEITD